MGFNYGSCTCQPSCDQKDFIINSVHYGKWRNSLMRTNLIKGSGNINLRILRRPSAMKCISSESDDLIEGPVHQEEEKGTRINK